MKKTITLILSLILVFSLFSFCLAGNVSAITEGYFTYEMTGGNAILTKVDPAISGDVVVPVHLGNFDILYVDEGAFKDCVNITSVTIPEEIDGIYYGAFEGCTNLTTVNFNCKDYSYKDSAGNKDRPVFANCPNLTTVNVGANVTAIPKFLFYGVSSLTTVNFAGEMPKIGQDAFTGCSVDPSADKESSSSSSSRKPSSSTVAPSSQKPVSSEKPESEIVSSEEPTAKPSSSEVKAPITSNNNNNDTTTTGSEGGGMNLGLIWGIAGGAIVVLAAVFVILLKGGKGDDKAKADENEADDNKAE
ncbi:MAG: leucine-rich repeat domain-containing protein [Clostridia bacterium]|nr:leucine-rich repeat domain-containing protein [Clostridia bacterium]